MGFHPVLTTQNSQTQLLDSANSTPRGQKGKEGKGTGREGESREGEGHSNKQACQSSLVPTLIIDWLIKADKEIFLSKARTLIAHPQRSGVRERETERARKRESA